jgi:hypothetical protein
MAVGSPSARVKGGVRLGGNSNCTKEEDFIRFYRDAVTAGHDGPGPRRCVTSISLAITSSG